MNLKNLFFYLSFFCFPISFLAFINILYSFYFDYFLSIESYFITLVLSLAIGFGLNFFGKKGDKKINFFDQIILIIFVYLVSGFLISVPFYLSNFQITFIVVFESVWINWNWFFTLKTVRYLDPTPILWRFLHNGWEAFFSFFLDFTIFK